MREFVPLTFAARATQKNVFHTHLSFTRFFEIDTNFRATQYTVNG
jgi:hypothetical protein